MDTVRVLNIFALLASPKFALGGRIASQYRCDAARAMLGGLFVLVYRFRRPQGFRAAGCFSLVSLLEYPVPFRLRARSCMDLRELVGYIICVVFDNQALAELKAMRLDMQELRSDNTRLRSDHKQLALDNARLQDRVKRLEARVGAGAGSPASTFRPLDAADAASFCSCSSFNSSVTVNGTVNQVDLAKLQASVTQLQNTCLKTSGDQSLAGTLTVEQLSIAEWHFMEAASGPRSPFFSQPPLPSLPPQLPFLSFSFCLGAWFSRFCLFLWQAIWC